MQWLESGGLVILAFGIIGFGIKLIDDVFDEGMFSRKVAFILAPVLVAIWMAVSIYDQTAATILFSILAGVLLTGKIDNIVFKASACALILGFFVLSDSHLLLLPFVLLTLAGVLDEKGNDYADRGKGSSFLRFFFLHRFSMKLCIIFLSLFLHIPSLYVVAFLVFDCSYDAMGVAGHIINSKAIIIRTRLAYLLASV